MKSLFRPKGAIAFILIVILIILFWWLLADWLLKQGIEQGAGTLLETQVELESAQLQLSPFGFKLNGLQVTNPDDPMQNVISAATISGYLQPLPLLMGQVIISELKADSLQLYTARTTPGIIPEKTQKKAEETTKSEVQEQDSNSEPFTTSLPNVDELLERLPITTITLAKNFDEDTQVAYETLDQQFSELPNKASYDEYKQRLKIITKGKVKSPQDFKQREADLKQLKKEIRADKQAIIETRDNIKQTQQQLTDQWDALKNAPKNDLELLKQNYGFSGDNLSNISGLLFGGQAKEWTNLAEPYLKQAQQLISESESTPPPPLRGEGRFVHFTTTETSARPDFLIQQATLNIKLPTGEVELTANNITHQPEILGSPMTINITGHNLKNISQINIDGVFDYRVRGAGFSKIEGKAQQWQLQQVALNNSSKKPIIIANMTQAIEGNILIQNGQLQGDIRGRYNRVKWVQSETPSTLQKLLSNIQDFDMQLALQGEITKPKIEIHSNLDKRLNKAFNQQLKQEQKALEVKLSKHLNQQITQRSGDHSKQLNQLDQKQNSLKQQLSQLEKMLKSEVKNSVEDKKDELKDKLKNKLKDKFKF